MSRRVRLGLNIDHVATLRNARGGLHPSPVRAALAAEAAGVDNITLHIREDRRHVRERDLQDIARAVRLPINLEMAATEEMLAIALQALPHAVCIVPERRDERTTEGGLNAVHDIQLLTDLVARLASANIRAFLFLDPEPAQIEAAATIGATGVELHTGAYCEAVNQRLFEVASAAYDRLDAAARACEAAGLEIHAGHGISFETASAIASLPGVSELNIGHFIIGEAIFSGLSQAIAQMRAAIEQAA